MAGMSVINQERAPNFRNDEGQLYLVRCFRCDPVHGRENWAINVASGVCTWCGWQEGTDDP
jgi:hypothetical protein